MNEKVLLARTDDEIRSCYPVMAELRPHVRPNEFLARVKRQHEIAGYELAYLKDEMDGEVKSVGGFRISESLAWGKFMYVDDLVSLSDARSKGYGGAVFDWMVEYAKQNGCDQFHLDSNVTRFRAHRFYLIKRMTIDCHHFGLRLKE